MSTATRTPATAPELEDVSGATAVAVSTAIPMVVNVVDVVSVSLVVVVDVALVEVTVSVVVVVLVTEVLPTSGTAVALDSLVLKFPAPVFLYQATLLSFQDADNTSR
mmetsp:Transcript_92885/g.289127  ORF Transcript_92885/g.289127 Transcript_92885/m.289127 type:complete len:107 (-) Transcript_92885:286-606(-)